MKLMSCPAFISTPFISPNSLATSSAVRIANCSSSSARRSSGLRNPRTFDTAKRVELRAESFQILAERANRLVSGDDLARCAAAASPAASATNDATAQGGDRLALHQSAGKSAGASRVRPVGAVGQAGEGGLHVAELSLDHVQIGTLDVGRLLPKWRRVVAHRCTMLR